MARLADLNTENLPEEIPFFAVRLRGSWAAVGVILIFGGGSALAPFIYTLF